MEVEDITKLASSFNTLWNKFLNTGGGGGKEPVKDPCNLMNFPTVTLSTPDQYYAYLGQVYFITFDEDEVPREINVGDYSFTPKFIQSTPAIYPGNIGRYHNEHPDDPITSYRIEGWEIQMKSHNGEEECPPVLYMDPFLVDAKGSYHIRITYNDN